MGATFARGVAFLSRGAGRGGQLRGIQSVPHAPVKGRGQAKGRGLTRDVDLIRSGSSDFQLQAAAALRVVHTAQRGHAAHTAPVHVHLAAWGDRTEGSTSGPALNPRLHSPAFTGNPDTALLQGPRKRQVLAGAASVDSQEHFMPWCTSP